MANIKLKPNDRFKKQLRKRTAIAFSVFAMGVLIFILAWQWLQNQPKIDGAKWPLRKAFEFNTKVFSKFFSHKNLEPTYPKSKAAKNARVNGDLGMGSNFDPASWNLKIFQPGNDTLILTLDDIKALPKIDLVFNFKCIEGWSQITHWGGVKFSDFADKYKLGTKNRKMPKDFPSDDFYKYVGLITPDQEYYVGIDYESMFHPQTILCYELNGKPLPMDQGAPLRLIIPVKYGIKSLKRIGTLYFSDQRPPDYWAERGYDYYSGL